VPSTLAEPTSLEEIIRDFCLAGVLSDEEESSGSLEGFWVRSTMTGVLLGCRSLAEVGLNALASTFSESDEWADLGRHVAFSLSSMFGRGS
jgi:hypothetical protein